MTTAIAHVNQNYGISVHGKSYPKPEPALSPIFTGIRKGLTNQLLLKNASRSTLHAEFGKRVGLFVNTFQQIKDFLIAIHRSNMSGTDFAAIAAKQESIKSEVQKITYSPAASLTAEVAILPEKEQLEYLNKSIELNVGALVAFLSSSLDALVAGKQAGLIEWFSADVCRFHYFLEAHETKDTILDHRHTAFGGTHTETFTRETTQTVMNERHQHDLVDAQVHAVGKVYVPFRISTLTKSLPDMFRPYFSVVTGNQIFEHVVREIKQTTSQAAESRTWHEPPPMSVWRLDPALTIGEYVVAGWDEVEERQSREQDALWGRDNYIQKGPFSSEIREEARVLLHVLGVSNIQQVYHAISELRFGRQSPYSALTRR